MKREKTKYDNIYSYTTKKGVKKYGIRKNFEDLGKRKTYEKGGFETIPEAKSHLLDIDVKIDKGWSSLKTSDKVTLDDVFEQMRKSKVAKGKWSPDTEYNYISKYNAHFKNKFGHRSINKISRSEYDVYINSLLKKYRRKSVTTINVLFDTLTKYAENEGILEKNVFKNIEIGVSNIDPIDKSVSLQDVHTWLDCAEDNLAEEKFAFFYLASFGMRRGEILALTKKDITFFEFEGLDVGEIDIHNTTTRLYPDGKGRPKTSSSNRKIIVDIIGVKLLEAVIKTATNIYSDIAGMPTILNDNAQIFINPKTGKVWSGYTIMDWYNHINDICGIRITTHMLRHYFATRMASLNNVSPLMVQKFLGHSDVAMTSHYTHQTREANLQILRAIGDEDG